MSNRLPGPKGLPIIGDSYRFARDPLRYITACQEAYGDIAKIPVVNGDLYLVMNPESIRQVFTLDASNYKKPEYHPNMHDLFGKGMLLGNDDLWIQQRQRAQPAFNMDRLKELAGVMVSNTENVVSDWSNGDLLYVNYELAKIALKIISESMFGYDLGAEEIQPLINDMKTVGQRLEPNIRDMIFPPQAPTQSLRDFQDAASNIDDLLDTIIRDRQSKNDTENKDYLSVMLRDHPGDGIDEQLIHDELTTILLAGNDTTATTMSLAWHFIARNPVIEQKLHKEVEDVLGQGVPEFGDIRKLEYTEQILKETMRMCPPVYSVLRETIEETQLSGYRIPEGTVLMLPQWGVHRDSRWYEDPKVFDPDRWTPERSRNRPEYAYFPFGGGARRCIGENFAMMEGKIVLSLIAQKYRLEPVSDDSLKLVPSVTLHPDSPIEMIANKRT